MPQERIILNAFSDLQRTMREKTTRQCLEFSLHADNFSLSILTCIQAALIFCRRITRVTFDGDFAPAKNGHFGFSAIFLRWSPPVIVF